MAEFLTNVLHFLPVPIIYMFFIGFILWKAYDFFKATHIEILLESDNLKFLRKFLMNYLHLLL